MSGGEAKGEEVSGGEAKGFWERYLTELATHRFNRFSLTLGLGYNFPRNVYDTYFYFAYPFLVSVPGYDVRVPGLSGEERERNLSTLRFIGEQARARGLHFQLGLWTHAYQWIDSPHANYVVEGLTPENHAAYCRDAVRTLLEACPAIDGLTFRVHGESGIPEGSYDFWRTVFAGVVQAGRRVEIDMHAKGIDREMIQAGLATGLPVNVSAKYWAEHMGLPYHQAAIRELEQPRPVQGQNQAFMALSGGSRRFTRYGYADLLTEDRLYGVLFRIWPGTQRLLLWGDPAMAAGYGRYSSFSGCLGVEICEPLSFKGRMGSGSPGGREPYADATLRPAGGDWEKYRYTYRLLGRLLYNPEADPETWRRFLRRDLFESSPAAEVASGVLESSPAAGVTRTAGAAEAAEAVEAALANASRILLLVTTAYHPSASNNRYWPEIYTNMPIVDEARPHPYGDTPNPKRFGAASPLDPGLFSRVDDFAEELLRGERSARYSPLDVAAWLEGFATAASGHLAAAEAQTGGHATAAFRRLAVDVAIQSGLGRFFAHKLRAGVAYALYARTGHVAALRQALETYRAARAAWAESAQRARGVYVDDLTFGRERFLRGHWADRLEAIDQDISDMEAELAKAGASGDAGEPQPLPALAAQALAGEGLARLPEAPSRAGGAHTPPAPFVPGEAVEIQLDCAAGSQGNGNVVARLRYRHVNQAEAWQVVDMDVDAQGQGRDGRTYRATIPGDYTDSPYPLQYFFDLRDGPGSAWLYPGFARDLSNQPYFLLRQARH